MAYSVPQMILIHMRHTKFNRHGELIALLKKSGKNDQSLPDLIFYANFCT